MAQETQTGVLYQARGVEWGGRWEGGSKGRGQTYTYASFILRFDRKQQNSVKKKNISSTVAYPLTANAITLMAESEEELKNILMKVKEESEKADLKLNIHKTKIMASGPITSWQINGEK